MDFNTGFHLVQWFYHRHQLDFVAAAWYMHCSLTRWCEANNQAACPFVLPICGVVQSTIFLHLNTTESHRVSLTCLLLFADRRDLFLQVTEIRLGLALSSYSVITPPLAAWSVPTISTGTFSDSLSEAD